MRAQSPTKRSPPTAAQRIPPAVQGNHSGHHLHTNSRGAARRSVVVLEAVGGHGDVATRVGAALALGLLVAEVLAAHRAQHLVRLCPVALRAELVDVCGSNWDVCIV